MAVHHGVQDQTLVAPEAYELDYRPAGPARAMTRSSSTCSWTMRATSRSTRSSRSISARTRPPLLAVWGKNDPFFLPRRRRGVQARQSRAPRSTSTTPATSRWKPTIRKLPAPFGSSSAWSGRAGPSFVAAAPQHPRGVQDRRARDGADADGGARRDWRSGALRGAAGEHTFAVRCVDGQAQRQIEESAPPHPSGATGLHQVTRVVR